MSLKGLGYALLLLSLVLLSRPALAQGGAKEDGKIVEQAPFAPPAFEQVPDRFKQLYGRERIERVSNSPDLELLKIKYLSDGLKVSGFIYKPKDVAGKRLPAVIRNRGGAGDDTIITAANHLHFYEMHRLASEGFVVLASQYRELRKSQANRYDFGEPELNAPGYEPMFTGRVKDAVEIFKLNVEMYPQGFNTYDSLGEAYLAAGERALAVKNYKRSLELNPQNTNATAALKRIEQN